MAIGGKAPNRIRVVNSRRQTQSPGLARFALAGLGSGAAVTSFLDIQLFAGFMAVAMGGGAFLAFRSLGLGGRIMPVIAAAVAMTFPPAVVEWGEEGMAVAMAGGFIVLAGSSVAGGLRRGALATAAVGVGLVVHLGLLGSFLVMIAVWGDRLLPALVLMVAVFELTYRSLATRLAPSAAGSGRPPPLLNLRAAMGGLVGCQVAALCGHFFLAAPVGVTSLLVLGTVVGCGAGLGHAGAAMVKQELSGDSVGLGAGIFPFFNAALFAAGTFYYGFRLYLA